MDKRIKIIDRDAERRRVEEFFINFGQRSISIQDAVKEMRRISRLTQPEFAKHRGISLGTLRQIETGNGSPTIDTLNKIGAIFGLESGFVKKIQQKSD
jgi:DNA-binding XRE family transcriptional regulator